MKDPKELSYDDLVEVVRTIQQTLFPGGEQIELGSFEMRLEALGTAERIMDDAGISPLEPRAVNQKVSVKNYFPNQDRLEIVVGEVEIIILRETDVEGEAICIAIVDHSEPKETH